MAKQTKQIEIKFKESNQSEIKYGQTPKNHKKSEAPFLYFLELKK